MVRGSPVETGGNPWSYEPPEWKAALATEMRQGQRQTEQTGVPGRTRPGRMRALQVGVLGMVGRDGDAGHAADDTPVFPSGEIGTLLGSLRRFELEGVK